MSGAGSDSPPSYSAGYCIGSGGAGDIPGGVAPWAQRPGGSGGHASSGPAPSSVPGNLIPVPEPRPIPQVDLRGSRSGGGGGSDGSSISRGTTPHRFCVPSKIISSREDIATFLNVSEAGKMFLAFLANLNAAIRGRKLSDACHVSPACAAVLGVIGELDSWVADFPPVTTAVRYGNPAYREWQARLQDSGLALMTRVLTVPPADSSSSSSGSGTTRSGEGGAGASIVESGATGEDGSSIATGNAGGATAREETAAAAAEVARESAQQLRNDPDMVAAAAEEIFPYFADSFGNAIRIDYGTGHEANFVAWLLCLVRLGVLVPADYPALAAQVVHSYLLLMRKLQTTYWLEPAGSHGVWGLDDYHFLPFILGSSQLVGHKYLRPKSIHNPDVLEQFAGEYYYFSCVAFVKSVKKGPLSEHSPMLNDISGVGGWEKVNSGMLKMFRAEVLEKVPIMQHFLFGSLLPWPHHANAAGL